MNTHSEAIKKTIVDIYQQTLSLESGKVADYIPQLAQVNPELYGISVCFPDGETFGIGDDQQYFCLQSCSKPLNYCISRQQYENLDQENTDSKKTPSSYDVHKHVGYEPSGQSFNSFILNKEGLPHNPMINAGAIMVSSLIQPKEEPADRFGFIKQFYQDMSGNVDLVGFDNGVFLSERHHADRNISLAYYMRENNAFPYYPTQSEIQDNLDLYFQCCSVTINSKMGSIIAATLANGGICPISKKRIIQQPIVKDCLSLMFGCGMYDFSGQFAFKIGLPAKSGVSGCLLLVIPNCCGICIFSPKLDEMGNTVRGVEFCKQFNLLTNQRYHIFNSIMNNHQISPCHNENIDQSVFTQRFITAASTGDTETIQSLIDQVNPLEKDYDGRTALHLAAAEGQLEVIKILVDKLKNTVSTEEDSLQNIINPKDRWGNTPYHEAFKSKEVSDHYVQICQLLDPGLG